MPSTPLTEDEKARIVGLLHAGLSRAAIARETGRSVGSVAKVAAEVGFSASEALQARTSAAREHRSAFCAERRAELAAKATEEAGRLLEELHGDFLVFNFGGKENTYAEHKLTEPPVEAKRQMIQGFRELMRTVMDIDRHDNRNDSNLAAVDEWLRSMIGEQAAA